ncbi:MAG TPA: MFS transporter [Acidimicrobiales bacterium]|nr:MFS transporter [Acidimicrobiales bacterium]
MSSPASLVRRDQRTALLPIGGTFVVFGMFWGSWAVATADVRSTYGLSDAQLGSLLAVAVSVSGIVGAVVGNRAERWGAVPTLVRSLLVWAVLLTLTGAARTRTEFIVVFIATMAAGGCVDMTMNAASASRLGDSPGRLVRFHGIFNVGALLGAIALGSLVQGQISWRWVWPMVAIVAVPLAVWVHRRGSDPERSTPQPVAPEGASTAGRAHLSFVQSLRQLHADGLLVLLAVFATAEIVEGGVDTWGVLYLRTHLAVTALVGASAYGLGQVIAILTRGLGGPSLGRIGPRLGVIAGAVAAGTGLSLEALAGTRLLAGIGLALAAGGSAVFWPLLMAHVSTVATRPTATVSAFTAAGYLGWVAGAPIIGLLADTWGLGVGLGVIAGLAGVVAIIMVGGRHL